MGKMGDDLPPPSPWPGAYPAGAQQPKRKSSKLFFFDVERASPSKKKRKTMAGSGAAVAVVAEAAAGEAVEPVRYEDVKAWIAAQEAYEAATSKPAPLTDAQRRALAELRLPAEQPREPEIGDRNWVGLLQRYRDAHKDAQGIDYKEDALVPGGANPRWRVTVKLSEAGDWEFPSQVNGDLPTFARKKDAKQFAARCAAEWLMQQNLMPSDGENVIFPKPKPLPPPSKRKPQQQQQQQQQQMLRVSNSSLPPNPSLPPKPKKPVSDDVSATQRIPELCQKLGFPLPIYDIIQDADFQGLWSGHASFDGWVGVAQKLGVVKNVYGKKAAKEKIAEGVLAFLLAEEEERRRTVEAVLGAVAAGS